jgi:anti-sigma B factor antagonist
MDLRLTTTRIGEHIVVALSGIADLSTAPILYNQLRQACRDHPAETLVIDLDGLLAIDDAALGLLLGAAARARTTGGDLELVCTNEHLRTRLTTTRVDRALAVRDAIA